MTSPPPASASQTDDTPLRLPLSIETPLITEYTSLKARATTAFTSSDYTTALDLYQKAIHPLPTYCAYELGVLHANSAACHLKLQQWKDAIESATKALEELESVDPLPIVPSEEDKDTNDADKATKTPATSQAANDTVLEVSDALELRMEMLSLASKTLEDCRKLRAKSLLRRAKARSEVGSWAELQGAVEDYTALYKAHKASLSTNGKAQTSQTYSHRLNATDLAQVESGLRTLPARLNSQKQKEVDEMMGKLKQLGNGLLKPFGLSTDNFKFEKDEKSGGYSMNFGR